MGSSPPEARTAPFAFLRAEWPAVHEAASRAALRPRPLTVWAGAPTPSGCPPLRSGWHACSTARPLVRDAHEARLRLSSMRLSPPPGCLCEPGGGRASRQGKNPDGEANGALAFGKRALTHPSGDPDTSSETSPSPVASSLLERSSESRPSTT